MRFMSIVCNDFRQALRHAVRELSEEVWAERLPFRLDVKGVRYRIVAVRFPSCVAIADPSVGW